MRFAKASEFAAGMGDAVSCGLTQKIRAVGGYDDVVDKNSGYYKGGEIAGTVVAVAAGGVNPCGATKLIGTAARAVSAVQGAGQLVNAAEAAKNGDPRRRPAKAGEGGVKATHGGRGRQRAERSYRRRVRRAVSTTPCR